jgi:hypothetical protein
MNLKLIDFIKEHPDNWKELLSNPPYNIIIKEDKNYIMLKYDQINSEFNNPIAYPILKECRGIIIHKDDYRVISRRFDKFWNIQEQLADKIDWSTARVQEKIDGSLMSLQYTDDDKWFLSTNGTIFAKNAKCGMEDKNFEQIFIETFKNRYNMDIYEFAENKLNKNYVYVFELVHPITRVVIIYEPNIYHIGTRDNIIGEEKNIDIGILKPKEYKFGSIEDVKAMVEKMPWNFEGYVMVDNKYNRVKCKSPAYLAMHRIKGGPLTYKRCLEIYFMGEKNEILSIFPEYTKYFDFIENKYNEYKKNININIDRIKNRTYVNKKEYAMEVKEFSCSDFFFKVWDKKYTWDELDKYLRMLGPDKVIKYMKIKEIGIEE